MFKLIGTIMGQLVYYVALWIAWRTLGWKYNETHGFFLGRIAIVVWFLNPFICAYLVSLITFNKNQKTIFSVMIWLFYLALVVVCAPLSNSIWLYSSGIYDHMQGTNSFLGETLAVNQLIDILGMVVAGILFVVTLTLLKIRKKQKDALV